MLGERSFGIGKLDFFKTLGVHCAVKKQKHLEQNLFNAVREWLNICHEIALGLNFMHCKSLLHNDLKTNNILLKPTTMLSYCTKIIDMRMVTKKSEPKIA